MPHSLTARLATRPTSTLAHIAAFGQRFGPRDLFSPEPAETIGTEPSLSRSQFIADEKAKQLDKGVEYLADANAKLQWDLNRAKAALPDTHVAVPKEDAVLLASYREAFPTPKEAKDAQAKLGTLEARDEQRSYDDARREALAAFKDVPEAIQKLIPTAEELLKQPGGADRLKNLGFMKEQVANYATAYGAAKQDQASETDVGKSPTEVKAPVDTGKNDEGKTAATSYYDQRYPNPRKEA